MPAAAPRRLEAERAVFRSDVRALGIGSSAELAPSTALGDARGERALALAFGIPGPGYHAFACGIEGPGRLERVAALVRPLLQRRPLPDWVFVHGFDDPTRPRAIRLAAGEGGRLKADLATFVAALREDLPKAFREESFDDDKARLIEAFQERHRAKQQAIEELAAREGFLLAATPEGGLALTPVVDGRPVEREEQFRALGPERIARFEEGRKRIAHDIRDRMEEDREEHHRLDREIEAVEREFAARIVRPRAAALAERYGNPSLTEHMNDLAEHLLDHLEPFRGRGSAEPPLLPFVPRESVAERLAIYDVNVVVDNARTAEPPVLVVDSPTYKNLLGTVDRVIDPLGRLSTDFRHIHAGALMRADCGAVVLNAEDALVEPFVWRILRRALRSGRVEIEAYDPFVMLTVSAIRPEPVKVDTKVVCCGPRWLFEMLLAWDEEFRDVFKILADFSPVVERDAATTRALCARIAAVAAEEGLLPFESTALDALVELAVREAGDRRRLDLGGERVIDAAREGSAKARAAGRSKVTREEVALALRDRTHRLDRIEQEIRSAIERGILHVDVDGERVGQVNALTVAELGRHAFAFPARLTATVGLGAGGVVSVEREAKLSGPTHSKGVLILQGFLRDRFARGRPLSLVATLAFEQSYATVEGDSASLAELLAVLSRVGGFPIRQDVAVTGSVDQAGLVQAIGAVNEKIEGFFDTCRAKGPLAGRGVVIPEANVEHLALRDDVAAAIAGGEFALYPVRTVEEALEVVTGLRAGTPAEADSLLGRVDQALEAMARRLVEFASPGERARGAASEDGSKSGSA